MRSIDESPSMDSHAGPVSEEDMAPVFIISPHAILPAGLMVDADDGGDHEARVKQRPSTAQPLEMVPPGAVQSFDFGHMSTKARSATQPTSSMQHGSMPDILLERPEFADDSLVTQSVPNLLVAPEAGIAIERSVTADVGLLSSKRVTMSVPSADEAKHNDQTHGEVGEAAGPHDPASLSQFFQRLQRRERPLDMVPGSDGNKTPSPRVTQKGQRMSLNLQDPVTGEVVKKRKSRMSAGGRTSWGVTGLGARSSRESKLLSDADQQKLISEALLSVDMEKDDKEEEPDSNNAAEEKAVATISENESLTASNKERESDDNGSETDALIPSNAHLSDNVGEANAKAVSKNAVVKFEGRDGPSERSGVSLVADMKARGGLARTNSMFTSVFDFKEDEAPQWRQRVRKMSETWPVLLVFIILTIWALFGDDIRLATAPPQSDHIFVGITYFMLVAFGLEIILLSLVNPKYFLSFYFWLDLVATLSLLFDIPAVNDAIIASMDNEDASGTTTLTRAGRTSRVGTRAGRIARVVRVIRLVRMLKIYKVLSSQLAKAHQRRRGLRSDGQGESADEQSKTAESRVGAKLTELTTRRVIVGVLAMLFLLPVFAIDSGYYGMPQVFEDEGLRMLHNLWVVSRDSPEFNVTLQTYIHRVGYAMAGTQTNGILFLNVCNTTMVEQQLPETTRRDVELTVYIFRTMCGAGGSPQHCLISEVVTDNKWCSQFEAILNMCRTLFTCLILCLGALLFSRDANLLVLHPLERMVQKVKEMSENPLAKMQIRAVATKDEQQMETRILENSITKICSLLAVGFGDAGAEVVAENIRNGGDLNPMVPGHRMMAIFGFCDIRRFTDATEVLQEEVMEFVNSIAKIVHMEVSLHGGSANKNIGDAFLLVWKLPAQLMCTSEDLALAAAALPPDKRDSVAYLADRALAAFVIIQVALKRSPRLKQFCMREDICRRMGDNFRVSMGFGLHIGWAIEGAIGSEYKIDASYLSPNVNMASRLEAATKQFGCSILMSDDFALMLSPRVRRLCRAIDRITVKGSNKPITLYTYDISLSAIAEPDENRDDNMENLSHSFLSFKSEFEENPDITESMGSSQEYRNKFAQGFQAYIDGKWEESRDHLLVCLNRIDPAGISVTDGPTASLLEVMGRSDFIAPRDWDGVRHLTDK